MRIISGQWRGRNLPRPVDAARPTPDRAREALFSILYSRGLDFAEARWCDLFCGSGAVGLEALSRGAPWVVFVDQSAKALSNVDGFLAKVGGADRARTMPLSLPRQAYALAPLAASGPFDVIFADPPYGAAIPPAALLLDPVMAQLAGMDTTVVWEREARRDEPVVLPGWRLSDRRAYGRVEFLFYERAAADEPS